MQRTRLYIAIAIAALVVVATVVAVRSLLPAPIPDPPLLAQPVVAVHINEINLSAADSVQISIDNLTTEPLTIDLLQVGTPILQGTRFFGADGHERFWHDGQGRPVAVQLHSLDPWRRMMNPGDRLPVVIEPGRSESAALTINGEVRLVGANWIARLGRESDRLVYVIDAEIPIIDSNGRSVTVRVAGRGETAFVPAP